MLLRPFVPEDFEALFAIQSRADVARWLYWEPRDADEVRGALNRKIGETSLAGDGVKGEWQSELVYALLEREWRARAPNRA